LPVQNTGQTNRYGKDSRAVANCGILYKKYSEVGLMKQSAEDHLRVRKLYEWEEARRSEAQYIAGVDEAGRGPMAGPVVAAAVILPPRPEIPYINDSKKLTPRIRERIFDSITANSLAFGIGIRSARFVDEAGIVQATYSAMKTAVKMLVLKGYEPGLVVVDGFSIPGLDIRQEAVIKGDSKVASVACASIIAKVVRDRIMMEFEELYPGYGFSAHKGYCTKQHMVLLNEKGPSPIHRRSFQPVQDILA
jgi:ribonuclease HII